MIYVGSYDSKVYAINPTGGTVWTALTGAAVRSVPAIGPGGQIYVGSQDGKLYGLNGANGSTLWTPYNTGGQVNSSPAIASDGSVIFGSDNNKVYRLNSSGAFQWSVDCWGAVFSSAVIGSNGLITSAQPGQRSATTIA